MRPVLVLALLALAGCDAFGVGGSLDLQTDQTVYAPEAEVQLTLRNETRRAVAFGALECAGLEVRNEGEWAAGPESLRYCTAILLGLKPGEQTEATVALDAGLAPGTYRFRFGVGEPDGYPEWLEFITSNAFEVR